MKPFKIRCSSLGDLMAGSIGPTFTRELQGISSKISAGKTLTTLQQEKWDAYQSELAAPPECTAGMKTLGRTWYAQERYNRRKLSGGAATTIKGILVEDDAIRYAEEVLGFFGWEKNEDNLKNRYMTGTPDVLSGDFVVDLKSSYDCFTFDATNTDIDSGYWHQLQGYMVLTNKPKAILVYALMDMPDELLISECWKMAKSKGLSEITEDVFNYVREYNTYSNLPDALRIKAFFFEAQEGYAQEVEKRVQMVRDYIKTLDAPNMIMSDGEKIYL